jgi:pilus assembly protein CpaB
MNRRLQVLLSLTAAIGATTLGHFYLTRLERDVAGGAKVSVLVASEDVPMGSVLSEKSVALRELPQAYLESRHIRASEAKRVLGVRVTGGIKANEAVMWSDLAELQGPARTLSSLVQKGMRAVSIQGRASDFDGLLRPGDRVDVLFTAGSKGDEPGSTVTLLQNLLVLSVGGSVGRADEEPKDVFGRGGSVTLGATVEQAQIVTNAKERGRLTLTLRNSNDITLVEAASAPLDKSPSALTARTEANRALLGRAQGVERAH